jgi:hypothetical protein
MKVATISRSGIILQAMKASVTKRMNMFAARLIQTPSKISTACYSVFKRGMKGVYQHCSEKHLHRYLSEFDFGYSNRVRLGVDDVERTEHALMGIVGKRLTYRTANI